MVMAIVREMRESVYPAVYMVFTWEKYKWESGD